MFVIGSERHTGEVAEVSEDAEVRVGGDEPALEQLLRQRRRERVRHHARVHLRPKTLGDSGALLTTRFSSYSTRQVVWHVYPVYLRCCSAQRWKPPSEPTSMIQGSCGPAWKSTSRPPAPHASMLMNARTLRAHLQRTERLAVRCVRARGPGRAARRPAPTGTRSRVPPTIVLNTKPLLVSTASLGFNLVLSTTKVFPVQLKFICL